ncbi:MAG TPA: HTTM domain-containing protein [Flavobacterium sp.]|uniref:HTTM domain-containing protein n=1 Tax=unclassified Flavobacterium TaxID=196869 RepID=UPI0025C1F912|nr:MULTISPECIES: HTTM domain-containing protein [unclassified Flavobacterium]HRE77647.1 HTTM domain-containing protein [Flavobacterium sp.]
MLKKAFDPIDNSPLILFRITFGLLIAAESIVAIFTGWVKKNLIDPTVSIPHIGFDFLVPLPGYGMYVYFSIMGVLGMLIMLGYKYRYTLGLYTLLWTSVYLMQKASYNNHYYLLILVCLIMLFLPANQYASMDAKKNPDLKSLTMPRWCSWVMICQMTIVYFFATLAKFYPDWLDGTFTGILFSNLSNFPVLGSVFTEKWFHVFIAYAGIFFDGLIIPALLWKRTRNIAFVASLLFHLFNSVTLQIGIFPYFALSFIVFFYSPETIRHIFFKKKPQLQPEDLSKNYSFSNAITYFFIPFFIIQLILPIRHFFIKGDVLWTEEAHRLSWRMMLRQKSGITHFKVIDKKTNQELPYNIVEKLTRKQLGLVSSKPDGMWQMAQHIKKEFAEKGLEVSIFIDSKLSVNNKPYKTFIDPTVDFADAEWNYFGHNDWILLYDKEGNLIEK